LIKRGGWEPKETQSPSSPTLSYINLLLQTSSTSQTPFSIPYTTTSPSSPLTVIKTNNQNKETGRQRKQELSFAADKPDHHYLSTTVIVSRRNRYLYPSHAGVSLPLGLGEAFYLVMGFV
jgi:hypothetical protein